MVDENIGSRVRELRTLVGITTRELDRLAGLVQGHTSAIEVGTRPRIEVGTAMGLATALGASLDWLLKGEGKAPSTAAVKRAVEAARAARAEKGAA